MSARSGTHLLATARHRLFSGCATVKPHIRDFVKGKPGLADLQGNTLTDPIFYFIFPIYQGDPVLFGVERAGRDACWHRRVYNFSYRCTTVPT